MEADKDYSFKKHPLSEPERLWLKKVYESEKFDPKVAKVELIERLPPKFNPKLIDPRLLREGKYLTLIGLWYADPNAPLLKDVEKVILAIKKMIFELDHSLWLATGIP